MILLLSAISIVYFTAGFVGAAPVPLTNPTSPSEPSYVAHTGRRGTVDVLLSCVITLTLCVYTSIHLNVSPREPIFGIFRRFWVYKFYWVLIAMFAPEFVLYAAYIQWRNARELCRLLKTLGGHPERHKTQDTPLEGTSPDSTVTRDERWCNISMVSAFYIVMGGFAYNVSDLSDEIAYIALTPKGFMGFAEAGLINPDLLKDDDIKDRSKADSLGKLLVCVQALWMVVNCIARKASHKPTTLIELNVIVHVVVAVVVYGLWWYKPLAVANPSLLRLQPKSTTQQPVEAEKDSPGLREEALLAFLLLSYRGSFYGLVRYDFDFDVVENYALMFMTGLLSCFYAGSHASAWSSHFPTYIERWIWRGACICIAAGVPVICALYVFRKGVAFFIHKVKAHRHSVYNWMRGRHQQNKDSKWILSIFSFSMRLDDRLDNLHDVVVELGRLVYYFFFGLAAFLYILSRLFIPLEAFISIRSLPVGAFDTVNWVEYWPHV
ncbi:hypothetical protein BDD12DRAFT_751767 [Trichophaea hybrida]|nr:hypothetical protein BDD12DRAFT_751767 [Trichophaea hybrida]